jgi:hypothetical protein
MAWRDRSNKQKAGSLRLEGRIRKALREIKGGSLLLAEFEKLTWVPSGLVRTKTSPTTAESGMMNSLGWQMVVATPESRKNSSVSGSVRFWVSRIRFRHFIICSDPDLDSDPAPLINKQTNKFKKNINFMISTELRIRIRDSSVPDPDPPDTHVFGPPGFGSTSQRYGSGAGSGSFYHHAKIVRKTLIPTILWLFLTFYLWKMM